MRLVRFSEATHVGRHAAESIAKTIGERPRAVLGLPTGATPEIFYAELGKLHDSGLDFSRLTIFMLDEYVGMEKDNPLTFASYMDRHFYSKVNVSRQQRHSLNALTTNPQAECKRYERELTEAGGFDLLVLGIGSNGHIAFNEPGPFLTLETHVEKLSEETIKANDRGTVEKDNSSLSVPAAKTFPTHAMTIGIEAIFSARTVLLLATGATKAEVIAKMVDGHITTQLPASLLQIHHDCLVLVDEAAAAGVRSGP